MNKHEQIAKGFTLIELLVVIAIIAILAAILFPVFAQAREKARQATCVSNLKQISIGFAGYVQDYDEVYPPANWPDYDPKNPGVQGNSTWQFAIDPYVKSGFQRAQLNGSTNAVQKGLSIWYCPSFDKTVNSINFTSTSSTANEINSKSYVTNANYLPSWATAKIDGVSGSVHPDTHFPLPNDGATNPLFTYPTSSLAIIQTPAQTVLVAEGRGDTINPTGNDKAAPYPFNNPAYSAFIADFYTSDWGTYVSARQRHSGGSNYLYFDGHVKWSKEPGYQSVVLPSTGNNSSVPVEAATGVVYSQTDHPNATGWFLEQGRTGN